VKDESDDREPREKTMVVQQDILWTVLEIILIGCH
jgi:hypothetical protein